MRVRTHCFGGRHVLLSPVQQNEFLEHLHFFFAEFVHPLSLPKKLQHQSKTRDTMKLPAHLVGSFLLCTAVHGFSPTRYQALTVPPTTVAPNVGRRAPVASSRSRLLFMQQGYIATNDNQPFIRPAPHNSPIFRAIAVLYALIFAIYQGSNSSSAAANGTLQKISKYFILPPSAAATVHLLSFATWFGTVVYTTFVAGITMFKNLPRRIFGTLQSKLFPLYFQLGTIMIGLQVSSS